jgi:glycyl-tRNA synthetase beta chain
MALEEIPGQATVNLLPALLEELLRTLPFPKSMRWGSGSLTFARPIRWLLALYGGQVVDLKIEGLKAGKTTLGHRFMAPEPVEVTDYADYVKKLSAQYVIVDGKERRQKVLQEVKAAVEQRAGAAAQAVIDEELVDIVTNLVESPHAVCGSFDEKFLALPPEVLITSMREHQKYFSVCDAQQHLLPFFVAVNNTKIADQKLATSGHERVLRARLEDALFFFNEDIKIPLADRMVGLSGIVFQQRLGTLAEKSGRIAQLSSFLSRRLAPELQEQAIRAAQLAKADLLTEMVGEFPTLQGIIGQAYLLVEGEEPAVAQAVREHYLPLRAGSEGPASLLGAIVGLADRLDTLCGCFAIGERPTGSKDAFGQRRLALGLIQNIRRHKLSCSLRDLVQKALDGYADKIVPLPDSFDQVLSFIRLRFEHDLMAAGWTQEVVEAATTVEFDDLNDCYARIEALQDMRKQAAFAVLAGSFKRIVNIIKENQDSTVDEALLIEAEEKELFTVCTAVRQQTQELLGQRAYRKALLALLTMKEPVDRFFEQVMVMDKDPKLRQNRLNLLTALATLVRQVGDISQMHAE